MKTMATWRAAALLLAGLDARAVPVTAPAPQVYLATEASAPYSMRDGDRVVGIASDTVREIMKRSSIGYTIDLLPWKRAYTAALERKDACVFSTTRTPEREPLFHWIGPIAGADWALMARTDRHIKLRTLDDAKPYRIGTYNGDARDDYLRRRGFKVDPAQNDLINPRKLVLGRIDLWAASLHPGSATLARLGYADKIETALVFNRIAVYLACNRGVPDQMVASMRSALAAMEHDGSARAIVRRYDDWNTPPAR